jgi:hypothetical protein
METSRLAAIPLFADLDDADLAAIAAAAVAGLRESRGEPQARQVSDTRCSRSKAAPSRCAQAASSWRRWGGDVFGEVAVLWGIRMATVVATSAATPDRAAQAGRVGARAPLPGDGRAPAPRLINKRLDFGRDPA